MSRALSIQRIAVIGCGYIGSALAKHWADSGLDVVATTTSTDRFAEIQALGAAPRRFVADQTDELKEILSDRDAVVLTVAAGRKQGDYRAVYLQSARSLAGVIADTPVKRIIYTSSTSVYHQNDGQWVDENAPTEPATEKGQILLDTERVLLDIHNRNSTCHVSVVRLAGIYGPGRDIRAFASRAAGSTRTDGEAYLNLIHRDDVVSALARLLPIPHTGVLNLSDGSPTPRREFYDRLLGEMDIQPIQWTVPDSPSLGKRVSSEAIKTFLHWSPVHSTCR